MARNLKGPNEVAITIKVAEPLVHLLDELAQRTERTRSAVTRMLIMKGLRLYEHDGTLLDVSLGAPLFEIGKKEEQGKKTKLG